MFNRKEMYMSRIVVWCQHKQDKDNNDKPGVIKPCVRDQWQDTPCGYPICVPMKNYLRDHR